MKSIASASFGPALWQGRPAPRCYVFRFWKQALMGSLLFLLSSFWLMLAIELAGDGYPRWLLLLPLPIMLGGFVFGPGQIMLARWRWPKVFYCLTSEQLIVVGNKALDTDKIRRVKIKTHGDRLASLCFYTANDEFLVLNCIEEPLSLLNVLREISPDIEIV
jgi:hypothetical protein